MRVPITKVDHVGIAVRNLEETLKFYSQALGLEVTGTEEVPDQKVRVAVVPVGGTNLEFLESTAPDGPVARFIDARGEGIHHLALRVDDVVVALEAVQAAGGRLIDERPRVGAGGALIGFIHPRSAGGVLLELCQRGGEH